MEIIFIKEDAILPDEAESLEVARRDRANGDINILQNAAFSGMMEAPHFQ